MNIPEGTHANMYVKISRNRVKYILPEKTNIQLKSTNISCNRRVKDSTKFHVEGKRVERTLYNQTAILLITAISTLYIWLFPSTLSKKTIYKYSIKKWVNLTTIQLLHWQLALFNVEWWLGPECYSNVWSGHYEILWWSLQSCSDTSLYWYLIIPNCG